MFTIRGAQPPARCVVLVVHTDHRYGLLVRLANGSLDHRVWQTTSLAGH